MLVIFELRFGNPNGKGKRLKYNNHKRLLLVHFINKHLTDRNVILYLEGLIFTVKALHINAVWFQ